jgi:hypothetical protein
MLTQQPQGVEAKAHPGAATRGRSRELGHAFSDARHPTCVNTERRLGARPRPSKGRTCLSFGARRPSLPMRAPRPLRTPARGAVTGTPSQTTGVIRCSMVRTKLGQRRGAPNDAQLAASTPGGHYRWEPGWQPERSLRCELCARPDAELAEDVFEVALHRRVAHDQASSDVNLWRPRPRGS